MLCNWKIELLNKPPLRDYATRTRISDMAQVLLWMWLGVFEINILHQRCWISKLNISNAQSHSVDLLFHWLSFLPFVICLILSLCLLSFQAYCLWCIPCSCLHLLLGCARVLSAHVKVCSVLNLWLPPLEKHPISISMVLPLSLMIHLSLSLRPAAFPSPTSYLHFSRLSGLSISLHLTPPLCLFRVHSLTPLISLSPLPAVSTLYSRLSYSCAYLPPLSFILSASPHHACELSHTLCSHQKLLALSWSSVTWIKAYHSIWSPVFSVVCTNGIALQPP